MADAGNGPHLDPEILALLARAEAAVLRSREVVATLNNVSRALADAAQRTDEWLAALPKPDGRCASDSDVANRIEFTANIKPTR
jgi:ABC-type transporter Mla subunit MlaD